MIQKSISKLNRTDFPSSEMKRQYGLGRKTVNKSFILYGYQQDNNKIPTNQVASFKDWICAATLPISAFRNGNQKLEEKWAGRHD